MDRRHKESFHTTAEGYCQPLLLRAPRNRWTVASGMLGHNLWLITRLLSDQKIAEAA